MDEATAVLIILGVIVLFACGFAVWIANTPERDEIDDAVMAEYLRDYKASRDSRLARRNARDGKQT
jgi:hypothetical protein